MESARGECGEKISLSEVVSSPFLAACALLFHVRQQTSHLSRPHRQMLRAFRSEECTTRAAQLNTRRSEKKSDTFCAALWEIRFFLFYSSALFMTNNVALYEKIFHRSLHPLPLSGLGVSSSEISLSSPLCLALPSRDPKNCITNHFCVLS